MLIDTLQKAFSLTPGFSRVEGVGRGKPFETVFLSTDLLATALKRGVNEKFLQWQVS